MELEILVFFMEIVRFTKGCHKKYVEVL